MSNTFWLDTYEFYCCVVNVLVGLWILLCFFQDWWSCSGVYLNNLHINYITLSFAFKVRYFKINSTALLMHGPPTQRTQIWAPFKQCLNTTVLHALSGFQLACGAKTMLRADFKGLSGRYNQLSQNGCLISNNSFFLVLESTTTEPAVLFPGEGHLSSYKS